MFWALQAIVATDPVVTDYVFTSSTTAGGIPYLNTYEYPVSGNRLSGYDYTNYEDRSITNSGTITRYFYYPDGKLSHYPGDGEGMAHHYYDATGRLIGVQHIYTNPGMSSPNYRYTYL